MKAIRKKRVRGIIFPDTEDMRRYRKADMAYVGQTMTRAIKKYLNVPEGWYIFRSTHQQKLSETEWYVEVELRTMSRSNFDRRKSKATQILWEMAQKWQKGTLEYEEKNAKITELANLGLHPFWDEVPLTGIPYSHIDSERDINLTELERLRTKFRIEAFYEDIIKSVKWVADNEIHSKRRQQVRDRKLKHKKELYTYAMKMLRKYPPEKAYELIAKKFPYTSREDRCDYMDFELKCHHLQDTKEWKSLYVH